jgi:ABC-type phosphate transport system substrate-binding protein
MLPRTHKQATRARAASTACVVLLLLWFVAPRPLSLAPHARAAGEPLPQFQLIVHPSNGLSSITSELVSQVFFKRATRWDNGQAIRPVDLRPDSGVRRVFSDVVLKRSVTAVRSYWQQRIFSGRELPPPELDTDEAVSSFVARSPGAIGYVSSAYKPSQTKILPIH